MDFLVGTFNTKTIYTLRLTPASASGSQTSLKIVHKSKALGSHSWLSLSKDKKFLYATAWTTPPSIAAYKVSKDGTVEFINNKPVKSLSGYVCNSSTHVYSCGGPTGEVFSIDSNGGIGELVQELNFVDTPKERDGLSKDAHGDFGGLRHGAHSFDLSPDGKSIYAADIGRNCIWTYKITSGTPHLELASKHISPRSHDGPRHTWPHPNGKVLYSLQEHSSMVDAFTINSDITLNHTHGVKIIPEDDDCKKYWADEVRLSLGPTPKYLYASTRGLKAETKGWVCAYALDEEGQIGDLLVMYQTPTSGGIANAVEPAPRMNETDKVEYLALTDSEEGWVFVLGFDGRQIVEVARVRFEEEGVDVVKAATAVWL